MSAMSATLPSTLKSFRHAALALVIAGAGGASCAADPVRASFDRLLAHEATPTAPAPAAREEHDPLTAALVVPLRDGLQPPARVTITANAADPVVQSFARLFDHEPSRFTPTRPEGADADPLIAAIVWPLMRTGQVTVAGIRAVTHP